jgi:hypothetical protein
MEWVFTRDSPWVFIVIYGKNEQENICKEDKAIFRKSIEIKKA